MCIRIREQQQLHNKKQFFLGKGKMLMHYRNKVIRVADSMPADDRHNDMMTLSYFVLHTRCKYALTTDCG